MKNDSAKKNTAFFLTVGLSAVGFVLLFYALPLTLDDWAWGSEKGLIRLQNAFAGYNGRYLGNLFSLLFTQVPFVRIPIMTAVSVYICKMILSLIAKKNDAFVYIASVGIYLSPILFGLLGGKLNIFAQTVGWVSGFSNYVISAAMVLTYLYLCENGKKYGRAELFGIAVFGFSASLFAEHITLFLILISAVFCIIKKEERATHIAFFIGCVLGGILMFSNSSYRSMISGDSTLDGMRGVGFVGKAALSELALQLHISVGAVIFLLFAILAVFVAIMAFAVHSKNDRLILPLVFIALITVPLLFTNGGEKAYIFTARLYFLQYLLFMIFAARVLKFALKTEKLKAAVKALSVVAAVLIIVFTSAVYVRVHTVDRAFNQRLEATKNGEYVEVLEYPESLKRFVYMSDAYKEKEWEENFKSFYGIAPEKPLKTVDKYYK